MPRTGKHGRKKNKWRSMLAGALAVAGITIAAVVLVSARVPVMQDPAADISAAAAPAATTASIPAATPASIPAATPASTPAVTPAELARSGNGQQQGDGRQQDNRQQQGQQQGDGQQQGQRGRLAQLTANADCTLTVPANPRTAQGLATPYVLNSAGQACAETNPNLAAFVQATILDPATGALSVYNPVVSDANTAATPPPVPVLPAHAVVTIWSGFNGNVLKLTGPGAGGFVNFAQQAYANSPGFFAALRFDEFRGKVMVPPLGTSPIDNMACPSTRDFSVVDQDQSDNVVVSYPQFSALAGVTIINGSDDASVNGRIDPALGCTTWQVPLTSATGMSTAGPLEEEQARLGQGPPVALVPGLDPFVTKNGQPDLFLQDLYRAQVGQPLTFNGQDTRAYCLNLLNTGAARLALPADIAAETAAKPPAVGALGTNLALHLAARFAATWTNLTCQALTGQPSPITVTATDGAGLATAATYTAPGTTNPAPATTAPAAATTAPAIDPATTAPAATDTTPAPAVTGTTTPADAPTATAGP